MPEKIQYVGMITVSVTTFSKEMISGRYLLNYTIKLKRTETS